MLPCEALQTLDEATGHRLHERRYRVAMAEEVRYSSSGLQQGNVYVQVKAVDAFELQGRVIRQDLGDGLFSWHGLQEFPTWPR